MRCPGHPTVWDGEALLAGNPLVKLLNADRAALTATKTRLESKGIRP